MIIYYKLWWVFYWTVFGFFNFKILFSLLYGLCGDPEMLVIYIMYINNKQIAFYNN